MPPKKDKSASRTGDLVGTEPPLTLTANSRAALRRGSVSLRWLAGAFVTGVAGAAMIGGALYTSVEGAIQFAEPLSGWQAADTGGTASGLGDRNASTAKGDLLTLTAATEVTRKVIQTSARRQVGSKEFFSIKPYELVTIPLAPVATELSHDLPDFNPLKIFADGGLFESSEETVEIARAEESDALAVATVAFDPSITLDENVVLSEAEIRAAVREAVPFDENAAAFRPTLIPARLTAAGGGLTFLDIIEPEEAPRGPANHSILVKSAPSDAFPEADEMRLATVQRGDTLSSILDDLGLERDVIVGIGEAITDIFDPSDLQPGHEIRVALRARDDAPPALLRMSVFDEAEHVVTVTQGRGDLFVAVSDPKDALRPVILASAAAPKRGSRASIYQGLYESGRSHDIPNTVLNQLVRVHSYDVDFQRPVQAGDHFTAFFELPGEDGAEVDALPLYIAMNVRGQERGFYKYRTRDDGVVDYYDAEGNSAKKFLIRKPINGGRFRSGYGMRRHPILGYRRMHKGVDWSAPRGTPIVAAGNGVVVESKRRAGYGNWVRLRHANGYETGYAHMTRRAKGITPGVRVRQGQVIGFVGSTGLSTGPHLHYEVMVNNRHVDPLRIRLPRGRTLQGEMLATFEKERARIDALMDQAPARSTVAASRATEAETQVARR